MIGILKFNASTSNEIFLFLPSISKICYPPQVNQLLRV